MPTLDNFNGASLVPDFIGSAEKGQELYKNQFLLGQAQAQAQRDTLARSQLLGYAQNPYDANAQQQARLAAVNSPEITNGSLGAQGVLQTQKLQGMSIQAAQTAQTAQNALNLPFGEQRNAYLDQLVAQAPDQQHQQAIAAIKNLPDSEASDQALKNVLQQANAQQMLAYSPEQRVALAKAPLEAGLITAQTSQANATAAERNKIAQTNGAKVANDGTLQVPTGQYDGDGNPIYKTAVGADGKPINASKPTAASAAVTLSPQAIDNAAATFAATGQLPALGMGGQANKTAIINRAAERATSQDPADFALQQSVGKAAQTTLTNLSKQRATVASFEDTARSTADLALSLAPKADVGGVPVLNRWINAGRKGVKGDPDLTAFDDATKSFAAEYAKVISGATNGTVTSDAARARADELLNTSMSPDAYKAAHDILLKEMDFRMDGFDHQIADQQSKIFTSAGGKKADAPTQPASTPAQVFTTPSGISIKRLN